MTVAEDIAAYEKYGEGRVEISAAVQEIFGRLGPEKATQVRFAAPDHNAPTNDQKLLRVHMENEKEFLALVKGVQPQHIGGIWKAGDLDKKTFTAIYRTCMFPFIWFWRLPALSEAKIKQFAEHAADWTERYMPNGLPILDHLALIGVMFDGLWDCFIRKSKGEKAQWGRKAAATKDKKDDPNAETTNEY